MPAAAEGNLSQCSFARLLHGLAHHGKCLRGFLGLRNDKIWRLEERGRQFIQCDELLHVNYVLGLDAQLRDLFGIDGEIFSLAVFVSLDDLRVLDRLAVADHVQVADSLAGGAIDLMETYAGLGVGGGKQLNAEGNQRDLELPRPIWTTGHPVILAREATECWSK